jgi:ribosomal protein S18 acetylase RimI-like enzyme
MEDSDIIVRAAAPGDFEAVGALGARLVEVHYAFDQPRFLEPSGNLAEGYASFLRAETKRPGVTVLVAERAGRIVGYAYAAIEPLSWQELRDEAGVIHDVYVDETARGHGIASRLVEAVTAWLRQQGMRQIVLHTASKNNGAQRLFTRLGFRPTMIEMTRDLE